MCERDRRYAADFLRRSPGVVAVVGVEGGGLVGDNRLCGGLCGLDSGVFLSERPALCFLFVSACVALALAMTWLC